MDALSMDWAVHHTPFYSHYRHALHLDPEVGEVSRAGLSFAHSLVLAPTGNTKHWR